MYYIIWCNFSQRVYDAILNFLVLVGVLLKREKERKKNRYSIYRTISIYVVLNPPPSAESTNRGKERRDGYYE